MGSDWVLSTTQSVDTNLTAELDRGLGAPIAISDDALFFFNDSKLLALDFAGELGVIADGLSGESLKAERSLSVFVSTPQRIEKLAFQADNGRGTRIISFDQEGSLRETQLSGSAFITLHAIDDGMVHFSLNRYGKASHLCKQGDQSAIECLWKYNDYLEEIVQTDRPMPIGYRSPDGEELIGWFFFPVGYSSEDRQRHPLVVIPYPELLYSRKEPSSARAGRPWNVTGVLIENAQLYTAAGYAVLLPSVPLDYAPSDPMVEIVPSIEASISAAIASGYVDADRLALVGHSFGGYAALSVAVQSDTFDALVASASVSNLTSLYGEFRPNNRFEPFFDADFYGRLFLEGGQNRMASPPWRDVDRYIRNSPLFHVESVQTPILLFHGDLDWLPMSQSEEFFTALAREQKDAQFVRYWGEAHSAKRPQNHKDMWERVLEFLSENGVYPGPDTSVRQH